MKKLYMKPETATMEFEGNTLLSESMQIPQGGIPDEEEPKSSWPDRPDENGILWGE